MLGHTYVYNQFLKLIEAKYTNDSLKLVKHQNTSEPYMSIRGLQQLFTVFL